MKTFLIFLTCLLAVSAFGQAPVVRNSFTITPGLSTNNFSVVDTNAQIYANALSVGDASRSRLNSFVSAMKNQGLWNLMIDGVSLRTNFNPTASTSPYSLLGNYATNHGTVTYDGAGAHTDGSTGWINLPLTPINGACTVVVLYSGATNAPGTGNPFGLFNRASSIGGELHPINNGNGELRLALRNTGAQELSSASTSGFPNGWFKILSEFVSGSYYLECNDFRDHLVSLSYDNAGNALGFADSGQSMIASGLSTVFTNGALNDLVLGASRDTSGNAASFAKITIEAAFVFSGVLSSNQLFALQGCVRWLEAGTKTDWFIGNSEMAFNFTGANQSAFMPPVVWWPSLLFGVDAFGPLYGQPPFDKTRIVHMATSGTKAAEWDNTAVLDSRFGNFAVGVGATTEGNARVWLGINDMGGNVDPASTFYQHLTNVWSYCRKKGMKVIAFTLPGIGNPRDSSLVPAGYVNTALQAQYNSLIRSDPSKYDALIELDWQMTISTMATNASPQISYDGLHANTNGNWLVLSNLTSLTRPASYAGSFVDLSGTIVTQNFNNTMVFLKGVGIGGIYLTNDTSLGALTLKDNLGNLQTAYFANVNAQSGYGFFGSFLNGDGSLRINAGFQLGTGKQILFSSTADANGASDVGIKRSAAGNLLVTDGAAGVGGLSTGNLNVSTLAASRPVTTDVSKNIVSAGNTYTSYAAGTAYTLTATPAQLTFGTTSPGITISVAGTYLVTSGIGVKYSGATYTGTPTITLKLRRTNNTAADLTNGGRTVELPVLTTFTGGDSMTTPGVIYTATAGDIIQLFGSVSATPSAGSVLTDSAEIVAVQLY